MAGLDEPVRAGSLITKGDMRKVFWRSFPLQASFNYERMQNVGFCYSMLPVLKRLYGEENEEASQALKRHLSFFNTTPQVVTFITGASIAMEEQCAKTKEKGEDFDADSITAFKAALMGPLAGVGDSFFWGTLRVIAAGVGCGLAAQGSILGAILFLLIFNVPALLVRYYGLKIGYEKGVSFLTSAETAGTIEKIMYGAKVLGTCVIGAMIASMVSLTTPLVIQVGEASVNLQSIFDAIIPQLLPLALTFLCFWALKSGKKTLTILLAIIAAGIVGAFFGIL